MNSAAFWKFNQLNTIGFYLLIPLFSILGWDATWLYRIVGIILVLHVIEIPFVLPKMKPYGVPMGKTIGMTLVFGFMWWLPITKGITKP